MQPSIPFHQPKQLVESSLMLNLDDLRIDVRQPLRRQAGLWAAAWFKERPDALILLACNGNSSNADLEQRQLRLRRIKRAMVLQGLPAERIRYTTEQAATPDGAQDNGQAIVWCRAVLPEDLQVMGVCPIETMLTH